MKIYLASDHAGFELKEEIKKFLTIANYQVEDCGAFKLDETDDYPDFIKKAAEAVSNCAQGKYSSHPERSEGSQDSSASPQNDSGCRGIVFGGSGQGEAMVANRYKNVRAAVYYGSPGFTKRTGAEIIKLSREHNDANILSLGARFISKKEAVEVVDLWLKTQFSKKERHQRRINKF